MPTKGSFAMQALDGPTSMMMGTPMMAPEAAPMAPEVAALAGPATNDAPAMAPGKLLCHASWRCQHDDEGAICQH